LSGKKRPEEGQVLLNDKNIVEAWDEFRHTIGYVPQDDVMHRDLTVFEVLYHATRLRLPADIPENVVKEQVNLLITRMGLAHVRDSLVGDENIRGISGGQRKRVNIAIELITEPSLLFLDEPTSGLDAKSTLEVMGILRELASSGKTIIMTIHQPRIEAFELLDNLILMSAGGKLAYYGPANEAEKYTAEKSLRRPHDRGNPADFVIDALENPKISPNEWKDHYLQSEFHKTYVKSRSSSQKPLDHDIGFFMRPFISQFKNLFWRYTKRKLRDKYALLIQLAQAPVIGLLLGLLFNGSGEEFRTMNIPASLEKIPVLIDLLQLQNGTHATLFLIGAAAFWLGCSNVARELVSERAIFLREKRAGLRPSAYLASVWFYQIILCATQTLLISLCVVFLVHLSTPFAILWPLLILSSASGIAIGLLISSLSKTEVAAISFIPIILIPQLMLSGYIKLYGVIQEVGWQHQLADLMPIRWSFEALAIVEYKTAKLQHPILHDLSSVIGFNHISLERPIEALLASIFLFLVGCLLKLQREE
jgi:ABC-type multidrug transport system ATPase subunit